MEVLQPSTVHALEAAHIDMQIKTAHAYPRNMETFKKRALAMVQIDEETAESCIYVRPVGKEKDASGKWVEKFAEGPSIRLAEIVSTSYGNIRVAARIVEQTERYVKCEGVCHDLESNSAGKAEVMESTVKSDGQPYSERQRALMAKVCISKAYRDAVFRVVPRALCKPIMAAAKRIMEGTDKPIIERVKRVQSWLSSKKIEDARVFAALNVKGWADVTQEQLSVLTGLKTSISEGDVTYDEAFPPVAKTPEATGLQKATGPSPAASLIPAPKAAGASAPSQTPPQGGNAAPAASSAQPEGTKAPTATTQTTQTPSKAPGGRATLVEEPEPRPSEPAKSAESGAQPAETSPPEDHAAEAAAGLAPETPPSEPGDFMPDPKDSEAVNNIKFLSWQAGVTEAQVMAWAKSSDAKLAKPDQKTFAELSTQKLVTLGKGMQADLEGFKKRILEVNKG